MSQDELVKACIDVLKSNPIITDKWEPCMTNHINGMRISASSLKRLQQVLRSQKESKDE